MVFISFTKQELKSVSLIACPVLKSDQGNVTGIRLSTMAFLVFFAAATWALLVTPHFTSLRDTIKSALLGCLSRATGTSASRPMALVPTGAFFSYDHDSPEIASYNSVG